MLLAIPAQLIETFYKQGFTQSHDVFVLLVVFVEKTNVKRTPEILQSEYAPPCSFLGHTMISRSHQACDLKMFVFINRNHVQRTVGKMLNFETVIIQWMTRHIDSSDVLFSG